MPGPLRIEVEEGGVYLHDNLGEIVCWVDDEWIEDPDVTLVIVNAILYGQTAGTDALRERISHPIRTKTDAEAIDW